MVNNYIAKNDMIVVDDGDLTSSNSKVTKEIMTGVSDCASLINAIENYNDTNKLGLGKRINYAVSTGTTYISVLRAYPVGASHMCVIGWDSNGKSVATFDINNTQTNLMSGISTHLIPNDKIHDVVLGSCDPDKLTDIFETFKTNDDIDENVLLGILERLYQDITDLITTNNYRGAVEIFNYTIKSNNLNNYDYHHKRRAYNKYVDVYVKYITILKDIVIEYNEWSKTKNHDLATFKKVRLIDFVETIDDIDTLVRNKHEYEYGTSVYDMQYESWKAEVLQKTFTEAEVETFKQCIDYEHMSFDQAGNPIWKN